MKFKLQICLGFLLIFLGRPAFAGLTWFTALGRAEAEAKNTKRSVLLVFHGSDWCPPCIEMQKQVFDSPEFAAYAEKALVLVNVDFPEKKTSQSEAQQKANSALSAKFNVGENYPTLVLLDEDGHTLYQEAGYSGHGPAEVLIPLQRYVPMPNPAVSASGHQDVDVAEFAKLAADQRNVILDVRTPKEFEAGHIAGAINLDVTSPEFESKVASLDKGRTYLVHCASGVRSVRACTKLEKLNFEHLYNLKGGFRAWEKAGEPVAK